MMEGHHARKRNTRQRACARAVGLGLIAVMSGVAGGAYQERQSEPDTLEMQNLNFDSLAILTGGGGHTILFSTGSASVVVVDSKRPGLGQQVIDASKTWTDSKPVTTLINTHAHADHVGGNSAFAGPISIVAHSNTKANMARMEAFKGENVKFLPNKTFDDKAVLSFGEDRVELYYFGAGHTNGDAVVVFPVQRLAYLGDLFPGKRMPIIDASNGGSGLAFPKTLERAVTEIKGVSRVIPSHEAPPEGRRLHSQGRGWMSWADLQEYSHFVHDLVAAVTVAHQAGKSVEKCVVALTSALAKYSDYDRDGTEATVQQIYKELEQSGPR